MDKGKGQTSGAGDEGFIEVKKRNQVQILEGKLVLVNDNEKPLEKIDYSGNTDSEDVVKLVDNNIASYLAMGVGYGPNNLFEQWRE
ncbi:hypothetical protein Tco_0942342 [Tanacetum coccineum]